MSELDAFSKMRFALEQTDVCIIAISETERVIGEKTEFCQVFVEEEHDIYWADAHRKVITTLPPFTGINGGVYRNFPASLLYGAQGLSVTFYQNHQALTNLIGTNTWGSHPNYIYIFAQYPALKWNATFNRLSTHQEQKEWESLYNQQKAFIKKVVDYFRCGPAIEGFDLSRPGNENNNKFYLAVEKNTRRSLQIYFQNQDNDPMPEDAEIVFKEGSFWLKSVINATLPVTRFPFLRDFDRVFNPEPPCECKEQEDKKLPVS